MARITAASPKRTVSHKAISYGQGFVTMCVKMPGLESGEITITTVVPLISFTSIAIFGNFGTITYILLGATETIICTFHGRLIENTGIGNVIQGGASTGSWD